MMPQPMRGVQSQGMMRALGVVLQKPVEEFVIEGLEIGEQKLFVVIEKRLRAIEALAARVHFGCSRQGMPFGNPCRLGGLGELSRELRAIIMKGVLDTHRQYRLGEIKGLGCPETPVARYREGEANTGALVLC